MFSTKVPELLGSSENSSVDNCFEEMYCDFCEFSRHPDLEYDDIQPNKDGLTFSEYHNLEW
jgi:hypothetical protein